MDCNHYVAYGCDPARLLERVFSGLRPEIKYRFWSPPEHRKKLAQKIGELLKNGVLRAFFHFSANCFLVLGEDNINIFPIFSDFGTELRWPGDSQRESWRFKQIDSRESIRRKKKTIFITCERFARIASKPAIRIF